MLGEDHDAVADQVFVLRFWRERTGLGDGFRWRGQIRNLNTRQPQTVNDAQDAVDLILAYLNNAVLANDATKPDHCAPKSKRFWLFPPF